MEPKLKIKRRMGPNVLLFENRGPISKQPFLKSVVFIFNKLFLKSIVEIIKKQRSHNINDFFKTLLIYIGHLLVTIFNF